MYTHEKCILGKYLAILSVAIVSGNYLITEVQMAADIILC